MRLVDIDELAGGRHLGDDDVVREEENEGFVAHPGPHGQDGVADAALLVLTDVGDIGEVADAAHLLQPLEVALLLQRPL